MMDRFELQKLRDLPIEGVAERLGLRVVRHKCLCPFHDDHHASMSFKVSKNMFRCFVCGASGGTIDLVMKALRKDFKEACQWLGGADFRVLKDFKDSKDLKVKAPPLFDASRYSRFFERPWLSPKARQFLYGERKIDPRVVRWCRLTSWRDKQGVPWLQIPYYNREGQLVGIQNRNLGKSPLGDLGGLPRFLFPSGSQCSIYNLPVLNLLKPGDELYITEGCSDCWAMLSAGHKAIAIPSATLLSQKDIEILSTLNSQLSTEFHMYPDNDTPGERLFLQLKEVLPLLVHHQLPQDCKDYSEYYLKLKTE